MTNLTLIGMIGGLIGGPLMYFIHYKNFGGREVIGGVVLGVGSALGYLWITKRSILAYLDAAIPPLILAMGMGRLGCLMFGCCWGGMCQTETGERALSWAIQFPYFSPLYIDDWEDGRGKIPESLIWKSPESKKKEPIPLPILSIDDIDSDEALKNYVSAAFAFNQARTGDLKNQKLQSASKAYADAKKSIGPVNKFREAAAVHLLKLNAKPETAQTTWHDLHELAKKQHTNWVHPAQLYDFIALTLLFMVLSAIFWRRYRHGTVLVWAMIIYPINRVTMEFIRTDNPREFGGLTISQVICLAIFVLGLIFLASFIIRKPRSASAHARSN